MDAASEVSTPTPPCSCGNGNMNLKCAGYGSRNPGRFYYKCPLGGVRGDHPKGFIWYDEYHGLGVRRLPQSPGSSQNRGFQQSFPSHPLAPNMFVAAGDSDLQGNGWNSARGYLDTISVVICFTILILIVGITIGKFM